MRIGRRHVALLAVGGVVVGCSTEPYVPPLPPPEPIRLAVVQANVVPAFAVDAPPPGDFITARRQENAREQVVATLRTALQAVGGDSYARLEVIAADLTEAPLPPTGDVAGRLGLEAISELQLRLAADLVISDQAGTELARASAEVTRNSPIDAGTTVAAEEEQADRLVAEGTRLLIATLRQAVRQQLSGWQA